MEKPVRIAVIGGTGLLGTKCVHYFLEKGLEVINVSRGKHSIEHYNLSNIFIDILDKTTWISLVKLKEGTHIINAAAITDAKYCEIKISDAWTAHVELSRYLESVSTGKYIYISTVGVYKDLEDIDLRTRTIYPKSWYGKTKFFGEPASSSNYILRLNIIGIDKKDGKSLMEWAFREFLSGNKIKGYKDFFINPVSTDFVAQACYTILIDGHVDFGIYDLGSKKVISKYDLLKKIAAKLECLHLLKPMRFNEYGEIYHVTKPSVVFEQDWDFDLNLNKEYGHLG